MTEQKAERKGLLNKDGQIDELTENINVGGHKELILEGENAFGGKNPVGLYVPMTEDEQDVLHRIRDSEDLHLIIHGWGSIPNPKMTIGDHRIRIDFNIFFKGLYVAQPLLALDLELKMGNDMPVFRESKPVPRYNGQPVMVSEGMNLAFQWDIAIRHMNPEFVRTFKPGATGLTSRLQDKDTREMTLQGNMRLGEDKKKLLHRLEAGHARVRQMEADALKR